MEKHVRLKIFLPDRIYNESDVNRVVVPGEKGNLTVLPDRAPIVLSLVNGYVNVLDTHGNVTDQYFIRGGVADIADNVCTVSTEAVISEEDIAKYGVVNYTNWRASRNRKRAVIRRYKRRTKVVDEGLKKQIR